MPIWPLAAAILCVACGGGSAASHARTVPPAAATSATVASAPAATATPNPLASPDPDGQRVYDTVKKLAVDIGPRVAGTPREAAARDYLKSALESYGYDMTIQDFGFDASAFLPARVDVGTNAIPAFAFNGSGAGTAGGPLIHAGIGKPEEFPATARGAIALIKRGDLTFNEKVRSAVAAGAVGVIIYNNEAGRLFGEIDAVAIPVVAITQDAGEQLAQELAAGPLAVQMSVSSPRGTAYNIIARPRGVTTCTTVTGAHYDSVAVTGGADDNASGAATVLEVARVAAARKLPGANCFVLFSAEEFGLFGSRTYVERLAPDEVKSLRAMINLDVVGVSADLELVGDADVVDVARLQGQKVGVKAEPGALPRGAGSDHLSFREAHVPVVMLTRPDGLIHTPQDTTDRVKVSALADTVKITFATLAALNSR